MENKNPQAQKTNIWLLKGKGGGGIHLECDISIYMLLYVK